VAMPKEYNIQSLNDNEYVIDELNVGRNPLFSSSASPMTESFDDCSNISFPLYEDIDCSSYLGNGQIGHHTDLYNDDRLVV